MHLDPPSPYRRPGSHPDDWGPKQSYYRIEDHHTRRGRIELVLMEIEVRRYTPKGVRLLNHRVVLHQPHSPKRYACPSIEEALVSYKARKQKQAAIYQNKMVRAQRCEGAAERLMGPGFFGGPPRWQVDMNGRVRKIIL